MTEQLKIKLQIADRLYPMTIQSNQEEGLRRSAVEIQSLIKTFESNYEVRDKQDVLAMCLIQLASKLNNFEKLKEKEKETLTSELENINSFMEKSLSRIT